MFKSFLFGDKKKEKPVGAESQQQVVQIAAPLKPLRTMEFAVEAGGGKGWPIDATKILYHANQGLICVGTASGCVYVFGDGFQFVRPRLTEDPNPVVSLVALYPNKLMITYDDNSMVCMETPSLDIVDMLPPSWVGSSKNGDITTVYVDSPSQKNFVYVGSSEGVVQVLDVLEASVRICDYTISCADVSLSEKLSVSAIEICPKDERYLTIGYRGALASVGAIAIFDLQKRKVLKLFKTAAVTSMAWNHTGDLLYAATRMGDILSAGVSHSACNVVWNSVEEKAMSSQDEEDEYSDDDEALTGSGGSPRGAAIRRVTWLAPQTHSPDGCLMVLLGSKHAAADNDDLKSVIVGLMPRQSVANANMEVVLSFPPIPCEKVLDFGIVPSYDKEDMEKATNAKNTPVTPAILLLTSSADDEDEEEGENSNRNLKIVRCPPTGVADWVLEIGALGDARKACEVLPSSNTVCTSITALMPLRQGPLSLAGLCNKLADNVAGFASSSQDSLGSSALSYATLDAPADVSIPEFGQLSLSTPDSKSVASSVSGSNVGTPVRDNKVSSQRRLSTRDFAMHDLEHQLDMHVEEERWELALSAGVLSESNRLAPSSNNHRIGGGGATAAAVKHGLLYESVFMGHENGTIVAWCVSRPLCGDEAELGRGNVWLPLKAVRCGTAAVTALHHDEKGGFLCAADESGVVTLWETFDRAGDVGSSEILKETCMKTLGKIKAKAERIAAAAKEDSGRSHGIDNASKLGCSSTSWDSSDSTDLLMDEVYTKLPYGISPDIENSFTSSDLREVLRTRVQGKVSSLCIASAFLTLIVGMDSGMVLICSNFKSGAFDLVHGLEKVLSPPPQQGVGLNILAGAVVHMTVSTFQLNNNNNNDKNSSGASGCTSVPPIPAVYVAYEGGHMAVIDLLRGTLISFCMCPVPDQQGHEGFGFSMPVTDMAVMSARYNLVPAPHPITATQCSRTVADAVLLSAMGLNMDDAGNICEEGETISGSKNSSPNAAAKAEKPSPLPPPPPPAAVAVAPAAAPAAKRSWFGGGSKAAAPPPAVPPEAAAAAAAAQKLISDQDGSNSTSAVDSEKGVRGDNRVITVGGSDTYLAEDNARYVAVAKGRSVVYYDLSKFSTAVSRPAGDGESAAALQFNRHPLPDAAISRVVSTDPLVCSKVTEYRYASRIEDGSSDMNENVVCLSCVSQAGLMVVVSLKDQAPVSHIALLEGLVSDQRPVRVNDGAILPNGSCYIFANDSLQLYTAAIRNIDGEFEPMPPLHTAPCRWSPHGGSGSSSSCGLALLHGREQAIAQQNAAVKKRRSSVISMSAAPTDLYKIFAKTSDQRQKGELLLRQESEAAAAAAKKDNAKNANVGANKAMQTANELGQALEERGRKISRVALQMDEFKESASIYKSRAAAQKEQLKKRNARWGLF